MADKPETTDIVPAGIDRSLEPAPDYAKADDRRGLEGITKRDMLIPRLALAQALSPAVTDGDPQRLRDLKVGDLFNSVTKQIYGKGPLHFMVVHKDRPRAMEFYPIDSGGGVKDPDVPLNDLRLRWGNSGDKKADRPKATLFLDYLVVLLPSRELIALSFKSSGIKVAKALAGLIAFRGRAMWAGRYEMTTGTELVPKPHQVYKVANAGWVSLEDYRYGEQMWDALKGIDTVETIDRGDHDTDFDPEELEREAAEM